MTNITNEEHHAHHAIGSSFLKLILERSPLHAWAAYINPEREPRKTTPAMEIGTAWHAATFEPAMFHDTYVRVQDGLDKRTKEGKQLWWDIQESGRIPLSADTMNQVCAMAIKAQTHPVVAKLLANPDGVAERSIFWIDSETGVECKIRPDWAILPCAEFPNGLLLDGKSTDDASSEAFGRHMWNMKMWLQAAYYSDGFHKAFRTKEPPPFLWLVQERDAPYANAIYPASEEIIAHGRKAYRGLLATVAECQRTGEWPGYPRTVEQLELPAWVEKQITPDEDDEEVIEYV